MNSALPVAALAPHDYRFALDAAMSVLASGQASQVICGAAELAGEVRQRIPDQAGSNPASVALWVEPIVDTWRAELNGLASALAPGASLVVVASRPLARLLPERRTWAGNPLGLRPGGLGRLHRALVEVGFTLAASYGVHSGFAVALSLLSQLVERWGYPDMGDRLHFAARLCYCTAGPLASLATVALLIARKD